MRRKSAFNLQPKHNSNKFKYNFHINEIDEVNWNIDSNVCTFLQ